MKDFYDEYAPMVWLLLGLISIFVGLVLYAIHDSDKQLEYMQQHHCVATQEMRKQAFFVVVSDGKSTVIAPYEYIQVKHTCDNNENIWR